MEPNMSWYNEPIFTVVLTIVLTLLTTQLTAYLQRRKDKAERALTLKIAFHGEISAIRNHLQQLARDAYGLWRNHIPLMNYALYYPHSVFDSTAGQLGDLQDSKLVEQISLLYSSLSQGQEMGRILEENKREISGGIFLNEDIKQNVVEYAHSLIRAFYACVLLNLRLAEQTKHIVELDWEVTPTKKDNEDRKFCAQALKEIEQPKNT
jgi:hypothetical protein